MRLISYNIHKGIGGRDRLYRLERIIDVIRAEKPDIVLLQEVDRNVRRSRFDDQPDLIAKKLGLPRGVFQFNHRVGKGGYGNLVLSRWGIHQKHDVSLRYKTRKNRRAQVAIIESPHGPLRVVNWHLGLAEKERQWQVRHLLAHARYNEYSGLPTLVVGDTNDWRNTLHSGAFADSGLHPVGTPPSRFRSFPAYMPVGALDKAFCCDQVRVQNAHIVMSANAKRASDHLPLVVEFEVS